MNEGSLIREIWRENRKLIAILGITTIILIVVFVVMMIVKNATENGEKPEIAKVTEMNSTQEAEESELDLDLYYNDISTVIYHVCRYKMDNCQIGRGKLLGDGSWYVTTIKEPQANQWSFPKDTYRVVLHRAAGVWKIVAGPGLVFSYDDYPNIPKEVLKSANDLE